MAYTITGYLRENFPEIEPRQFYRIMFPEGELDRAGAFTEGKYTGIVTAITSSRKENGKLKVKRYTLTDELDAIDKAVQSDDFCICRPLSYAGKEATAERARFCYALAVDVDKIIFEKHQPIGLRNLWERHVLMLKRIPKPTAIVSSGSGIHLYYVFEQPVALFRDAVLELQELKRALTRLIWDDTIVSIKSVSEIQQEGIYQGFRMPGTITKDGGRASAYLTGNKVTVEYLNGFVPDIFRATKTAKQKKRGKIRLEDAKEKYTDWYNRRIIQGKEPGVWTTNRRVYDWWKEQILNGAEVGHRYYCLMTLAIFAQKCSHYNEKLNPEPVTREELERDCIGLLDFMEKKTVTDDNHFTEADVLDALEAFDSRWTRYPRSSISLKSGIPIPENKRNGRKQSEHIKLMNLIRDEINHNTDWNRHGNGRKNKAETVRAWRQDHPDGNKAECIRDTGLTRPTVKKWWDQAPDQRED